jgi:hypothetical protein
MLPQSKKWPFLGEVLFGAGMLARTQDKVSKKF